MYIAASSAAVSAACTSSSNGDSIQPSSRATAMPFFLASASMCRCHFRWPIESVANGTIRSSPLPLKQLSRPPRSALDLVRPSAPRLLPRERVPTSSTAAISPTNSHATSASCHALGRSPSITSVAGIRALVSSLALVRMEWPTSSWTLRSPRRRPSSALIQSATPSRLGAGSAASLLLTPSAFRASLSASALIPVGLAIVDGRVLGATPSLHSVPRSLPQ